MKINEIKNNMKINEIKNNKYKIIPYKMANDALIKNVYAPLPNFYNFFMLLIGRPNSGKTTFFLNLIKKSRNNYYKKFDRVYIFSASLQTITESIDLDKSRIYDSLDYLEGVIDDLKADEEQYKTLIVIDDLVCDLKETDYLLKLIFNRRHINSGISLIITSQVYNKIPLKIRKGANILVLFHTTNKKELQAVYDEFINKPKEEFLNIVRYCFNEDNHEFIVFDNDKNLIYHNFNLLEFE